MAFKIISGADARDLETKINTETSKLSVQLVSPTLALVETPPTPAGSDIVLVKTIERKRPDGRIHLRIEKARRDNVPISNTEEFKNEKGEVITESEFNEEPTRITPKARP